MRVRDRWLSCVAVMLLVPIHSQAHDRLPLRELARPAAFTLSVSPSSLGVVQASGSGRDSLVNGTVIGAAVGAAAGMALAYATRDSELGVEQYSYAALVFGGIGAGVGLGVDALLNRAAKVPVGSPRRIAVSTKVSRKAAGVGVTMRW
jgi:hypothetical protein